MPLDYKIAQRTLANGLRVIVSEDHSVPNVTVNLWVNVGSRHEVAGRTGFAHLFEHLMFQGSRNVASGEHFSALMAAGGRLNATTWFDRTNYFETIPRGAMDLALWMEADRHGHLLDAVNQENLDNQRDVVKEEKRQRYDNLPYGNALIDVYAAVFPKGHPYHHATIGSMEDLDDASVGDVHDFFRLHYGPNNTVLTLVGDLSPHEGFAAAQRYFGPLPATATPRRAPVEPLEALSEPVRDEHTEDVPSDRLHIAFRLPVDDTPEFFALCLAMDVIGGLATSRLYQRLVRREQIATSISAHAMGFVDGVSLGFMAVDVADGVSADAVEAAVCEELVRFAEHGPTQIEMESAMAQTERGWLSSLASQEERADHICHHATLQGDAGYINTYLDRLAQVSAGEVQDAAAAWLMPQSRAVVAYLKSDGDPR
jgi:zinc protease